MASDPFEKLSTKAPRSKFYSFLMRDWPYLLMLALALAGVARTSMGPSSMASYWVVLAPVFGIICIAEHWRDVEGPQAHWQLIRTQALHWIAVMLAMYLVFMTSVNRIMNADADALTVLAVLALGTFTAGIHANALAHLRGRSGIGTCNSRHCLARNINRAYPAGARLARYSCSIYLFA
jgi:hypothetical protein